MTSRWKKLGRLYAPEPVRQKLGTHAANPLAVHLGDDLFRIFFSGRDRENRSSVGFVDVDIFRREVVRRCDRPVFEHGPAGTYFSHGVSIGSVYEADGKRFILFMGWHLPASGHWRGEIGRLVLHQDLSLTLDGNSPLISISDENPISLSYPWVLADPHGGYHMWYGSTKAWDAGNGEMLHVIKHAHSHDGNRWETDGYTVPYQLGVAQAFSPPDRRMGRFRLPPLVFLSQRQRRELPDRACRQQRRPQLEAVFEPVWNRPLAGRLGQRNHRVSVCL